MTDLGQLNILFEDDEITDILVNGFDQLYVERGGKLHPIPVKFTKEELDKIIENIVTPRKKQVNEETPTLDGRLEDGSRVNIVVPPASIIGPMISIRKFRKLNLSEQFWIDSNSLSQEMLTFLQTCVIARKNIIISGGTGAGKTSFLNLLSSFIPENERILTIEDAAELQLRQKHVGKLEARVADNLGKGEITIRSLVINSLRMRPDRIIVGECRGGEALDMLQAMNTGHNGSMTTIHANSPRDAVKRIETMVLMAGFDLPIRAIREQVVSAISVIVQLARYPDGSRKVSSITEVIGLEGDVVTSGEIFKFSQINASWGVCW